MLFRSAVGSTNTDFQIAAISNGANDMDLTFASDGGSERMRIDSSGNVGIGTTSPANKLAVNGAISIEAAASAGISEGLLIDYSTSLARFLTYDSSSGSDIAFYTQPSGGSTTERLRITSTGNISHTTEGTGNGYMNFTNNDAGGVVGYIGTGKSLVGGAGLDEIALRGEAGILFSISSSEKACIDSSGNFLVGTTSTLRSNKFHASSSNFVGGFNVTGGTGEAVAFFSNGTVVGTISVTGSATAYNTSSDARLKDVTGEARGLEVINALNPVAYNWKADGKADEGLIAQEVLDIVPNAVSGSEEEYYQMDYSKLVTHLVAGMKEQQEQIEQLKTEIQTLKGE